MKWTMLAVVSSIITLTLSQGMPAAQEPSDGPRMVLKEIQFHFGEVMEGATVEHAFPVLNRGEKPLEILNVKPG